MTVSRVNPLAATPVVEEKSNRAQTHQDDPHRSTPSAPPQQPPGPPAPDRLHPHAPRANLLANNARAGRGRKASGASAREKAGTTWNAGLELACELVQALVSPRQDADGSAGLPLREFEEMIRPLAMQAEAPPVAEFLATAIDRMQAGGLPADKADLLQRLEDLKANQGDANALGFYAVMAVMAAAAGIAESIRTNKVNDACTKVVRQVQDFAQSVASMLNRAAPAASPQAEKLIAMARAAMKVPFRYLVGHGMHASLSHAMMNWSRTAYGADTRTSQEQLEAAVDDFLHVGVAGPNG